MVLPDGYNGTDYYSVVASLDIPTFNAEPVAIFEGIVAPHRKTEADLQVLQPVFQGASLDLSGCD
jgi:hypothetical protein